jgi:Tol biopolymer transport system component/tRNA A-37 threonylcarbamoyl transferase component Bud32
MPLPSGQRIGAYEIVAQLGAGGMGEVYRARDAKLKRDVAIKVLPAEVASDRERLARFQREAEVLASLNHPHIAHVYGIEENALVMELVDGEDLSQRIARGPLPIDEALPIARQIAEALEAAHDAGIIHRDLKPANIKVRDDGTVKVLDFGLAKAMETGTGSREPGTELANSPTITSPAMTMRGVILGTAAYMSPEQAKGKAVDRRADIWAFGCVLFEMLTGTRAFKGDDVTDIITSVMRDQPDWSALPPATPAAMRMLLRRCLEKDPRRRLRDIGDARFDIEDHASTEVQTGAAPVRGRAWVMAPWAVTAAFAIVLAVIAFPRPPAPAADSGEAVRFELTVPEGFMRIGTRAASMSLSPDGNRLAFVALNSTSRGALFVRDMSSLEAKIIEVANLAWATPAWSPDGRSIVMTAGTAAVGPNDPGMIGSVRRLDPAGGPATTLAEGGRYPIWGSLGTIVYGGRDGRVYRVAGDGGPSTPITELDGGIGEVAHLPSTFLPDGRRFVFMAQNRDTEKSAMFVASIDGGPRSPLPSPASRVLYADGWLWFIQSDTLMAQRMDPVAARLSGGPQSIASGVADFAVSPSGTLVIAPLNNAGLKMAWLNGQGEAGPPVAEPGPYTGVITPRLSPDGTRMIFVRPAANGQPYVWQVDLRRNVSTRITTTPNPEDAAVYSPDGQHVVMSRGTGDLYRRAADGSGGDELLLASPSRKRPSDISPDGSVLLFQQGDAETGADIWALPLTGERRPRPLVATAAQEGFAQFSPDGRWIAYCGSNSGEPDQVFVEPYPPTGARTRLSTTHGSSPKWSANGREIYYGTPTSQIMRVSLTMSGGVVRAGVPEFVVTAPLLFNHNAFVLDERSRILALSPESNQKREPATVILNWPALLKADAR